MLDLLFATCPIVANRIDRSIKPKIDREPRKEQSIDRLTYRLRFVRCGCYGSFGSSYLIYVYIFLVGPFFFFFFFVCVCDRSLTLFLSLSLWLLYEFPPILLVALAHMTQQDSTTFAAIMR